MYLLFIFKLTKNVVNVIINMYSNNIIQKMDHAKVGFY